MAGMPLLAVPALVTACSACVMSVSRKLSFAFYSLASTTRGSWLQLRHLSSIGFCRFDFLVGHSQFRGNSVVTQWCGHSGLTCGILSRLIIGPASAKWKYRGFSTPPHNGLTPWLGRSLVWPGTLFPRPTGCGRSRLDLPWPMVGRGSSPSPVRHIALVPVQSSDQILDLMRPNRCARAFAVFTGLSISVLRTF